jgi:hypothetical protein
MMDLLTEAKSLQDFIEQAGWPFYFIGGIAVQVWGEPRLTQDIDLTVLTDLRNEPGYIAAFLERYAPKFSDADQFALTNRVLPMFTDSGIGIDVTLGGLSDTSEALRRSSYQQFTPEIRLRICSADDLVIMKTVAARSRDWNDIESVIIKQDELDWQYILETIQSLSAYEDMSGRIETLLSLRTRFGSK